MFKKSLLLLLSSCVFLFALTKEQIEPQMTKKVNDVISLLKNNQFSKEQKGEKIIAIIDSVFDYELMARLSLGKQWKSLSSEQQEQFVDVFTKTLKQSYLNKLDLYTNQKIKFLGIKEPKRNRVELNTLLIGEKENFDIDYKFYQKSQDEWKIYDINLLDVSIIQTYRQQFAGFLEDKTFEQLLQTLTNKK